MGRGELARRQRRRGYSSARLATERTAEPDTGVRNCRTTRARSLEQAGEAAGLEDPTIRLTMRAVAHHVVLVEDRLERGLAARARLALVGVDPRRLGELLREGEPDRRLVGVDDAAELGHHRLAQGRGLRLGEVV